jgi:uncharacterized protein
MEQQASSEITLILKSTRQCNLRCVYCMDHRTKQHQHIDVSFAAQLFDGIRQSKSIQRVSFVWHGGEPLLLGIPFFRKMVYLQQQFLNPAISVRNTVQTNACLLNEEWLAHFKAYGFTVGVSLDGPQTLHDSTRLLPNGKGSYAQAMQGIERLRQAEIPFGVLTVITQAHLNLGAEALLSFYEAQGIRAFALLSLRSNTWDRESELAYSRAYGDFMAAVVERWLTNDDPGVRVREASSKINRFLGLPNEVCKDGGPCVGKYFGVEADGQVWHCDKFHNDERFFFGNCLEEPFSNLMGSQKLEQAALLEREIRQQCRPCPWYAICNGGCLSDLLSLHRAGGQVGTADCLNYRMYSQLSQHLADYFEDAESSIKRSAK